MQRWQLTIGLVGLALGAALIAPTLKGVLAPDAPTPPETVVSPVVAPTPPRVPGGHLVVSSGLDRNAVLTADVTERFLTIEVSAPADIGVAYRRPVDLTVAMDRSGSMAARGKIDYAKAAAKHVVGQLDPDDVYSLVVFSDRADTVVEATHVSDASTLRRRIDRVFQSGDTNIVAGLDLAAAEIAKPIGESAVGRIVLLSDGKPTAGIVDPDAIVRRVAEISASGVSVSAIGLGLDYNEDLLARIADVGGGSYDFVDDPKELAAVFADELEHSASVVARSTSVDVDLGDGIELLDVFGWQTEHTTDGFRVFLGDVTAGETVKITARVRVKSPDTPQALTIAAIEAHYLDLIDEQQAMSENVCDATVTRDQVAVTSSVDKDRAVSASRAWGNSWLERSARAYEEGDQEEAKKLAEKSEEVLRYAFDDYAAPELAVDADNSAAQQAIYTRAKPTSSEGRRSIKAAKEYYRETSMH
ncbi:MAG: VWA domain-containing protein [Deltaproteobacteria bacterium]|nr:MAG: VWA domain-containing protein [Deltaproteobacteria bacterium]